MISVCIATYNGEKYLKDQLISILSQLDVEDEIIISDDMSTDSTLNIVNSLKDPRIKVFYHTHPYINKKDSLNFRYATKNFENALLHAKGDIIFLSDQDDIWFSDKVKSCKEALLTYDLVLTNFNVVDSELNILSDNQIKHNPISQNLFMNIIRFRMQGSTMAFTSKYIKKCLPFPKNLLAHDAWICSLYTFYGKVKYLSTPLIFYRRTGNNVSAGTQKSSNSFLYKIMYRFTFLLQVINRIISNYIMHKD